MYVCVCFVVFVCMKEKKVWVLPVCTADKAVLFFVFLLLEIDIKTFVLFFSCCKVTTQISGLVLKPFVSFSLHLALHLTSSSSVFSAHGESERNTETHTHTHTHTHTEHESFGFGIPLLSEVIQWR